MEVAHDARAIRAGRIAKANTDLLHKQRLVIYDAGAQGIGAARELRERNEPHTHIHTQRESDMTHTSNSESVSHRLFFWWYKKYLPFFRGHGSTEQSKRELLDQAISVCDEFRQNRDCSSFLCYSPNPSARSYSFSQ